MYKKEISEKALPFKGVKKAPALVDFDLEGKYDFQGALEAFQKYVCTIFADPPSP